MTGGCPGGADPAASCKYRWAGLRHQGRQRQLQTRLRSICRRATRAIRNWLRWAAITRPLCHRPRRAVSTGRSFCHRERKARRQACRSPK
ncbi:hypothetical protein CQY23_04460 [Mycobacterium celatum]|uniref:Uncharacterized protein n=1 Tax=Mycobacterium celatum TaxID=28045 RepID=A0A2G5PQY1_MYCCE|nr:hypothetical protein CQY23_04460 [Mycobacterium celatum]